jgi:hypothetical protein
MKRCDSDIAAFYFALADAAASWPLASNETFITREARLAFLARSLRHVTSSTGAVLPGYTRLAPRKKM